MFPLDLAPRLTIPVVEAISKCRNGSVAGRLTRNWLTSLPGYGRNSDRWRNWPHGLLV